MTLNYDFDADGVARVTGAGEVTFDETIDVLGQIYADPGFQVPTRLFWDLRAGMVQISAEEIYKVSDYVLQNRAKGSGRTAIVAHDDLAFGMSRMYELVTDNSELKVKVFRDAEAALDWLSEDF